MNAQDGSITMDNALLKMVREGTVTYETALGYARDREAFSKEDAAKFRKKARERV